MLHGLLHRLLHCFSLKIRGGMGMRVFPPMVARKFPIGNRKIDDYKRLILKEVCCTFRVSTCL